ncbi:hypothetical protein Tco_0220580 [Tanacetum coccineum]
MAYVNSTPSEFVNINPTPEPSIQDDPSVNKVHGSGNSSGSTMGSFGDSSSGHSTIKSANICPLIDVLGLQHWEFGYEFIHLFEGYFGFPSPLEIALLCALLQAFEERQ